MDLLTRLQEYVDLLPDLSPVEMDKIQKRVKRHIVAETIFKRLLSELDEGKFLKRNMAPGCRFLGHSRN